MSFKKHFRPLFVVVTMAALVLVPEMTAFGQTSSSTNYGTNEYYFGTGGEVDLNSTTYKARGSTGGLGVGDGSSTNYIGQSGFVTAQEEYLEMVVTASTVNLGNLTSTSTGSGTANFYIRTYTSSGYFVRTVSATPTSGAVSLAAMTGGGSSTVGIEQFGINLAANTVATATPTTFGAAPVQQPNSGFAYGTAAAGYGTVNQFRYNTSDTIATAPKGIGQTNFTISYIANISVVSRAGFYSVNQVLVVVASY